MSFQAKYRGEASRFMQPGKEYQLHELDRPNDPSAPKTHPLNYQVTGIPGNFAYEDKAGFDADWEVLKGDADKPAGKDEA